MSYWISHGSFAETSSPLSTTGVVSDTRQWLMDGKLVAIKMINSECVEDFDALKRVGLPPPLEKVSYRCRFYSGSYRNCALMQSSGSDYDIRTS